MKHQNLDLTPVQLALLVLRFSDLVDLGIVNNRVTLSRWIAAGRFPSSIRLAENSIGWRAADVKVWLDERAAASQKDAA